MPLPDRRWLYHTTPGWVSSPTFFLTICCQTRGINQLCVPGVAAALMAAVRHYHENGRWYATLWLLMLDHAHAIVAVPELDDFAVTVSAWKRYTARSTGVVWQNGFFDHRLRSDESLEEKSRYIRMNPVRKGLVAAAEDWPHVWMAPE